MTHIHIGTSGFAYKEWIGSFYPPGTKGDDMLPRYAAEFSAVEINNTFYRMPAEGTLIRWRETVPAGFKFVIKARKTITHRRDFALPGGYFAAFMAALAPLGDRLGPVLFQFPPLMKDPVRLHEFVDAFRSVMRQNGTSALRSVVEVRSRELWCPATFDFLRSAGLPLCMSDQFFAFESWPEPEGIAHLRLRRGPYTREQVKKFVSWLSSAVGRGTECFVFLKHETAAPEYAHRLKGELGSQPL